MIKDYIENGSKAAANEIVRKYQSFVFATSLRYLKSRQDAEDVSQEIFLKALKSLKKFRGDSSFKSWLYRITVNMSINATQKKKFFSFLAKDDDFDRFESNKDYMTPEQNLENKELNEKFQEAIELLPEKQRETFMLRYVDNVPYEEISVMLGTSVGGLKANYYHAVRKIADHLKNEGVVNL